MSDVVMADRLVETSTRIVDADGRPVGAAFPLAPRVLATCAHVVAAALGYDPSNPEPPADAVPVELSSMPGRRIPARVRQWIPVSDDGRGDIAILELPNDIELAAQGLPFWPADRPWGGEFRMFGFPVEVPGGVWTSGEFRAAQSLDWIQLQVTAGSQPITGGFSGAPSGISLRPPWSGWRLPRIADGIPAPRS